MRASSTLALIDDSGARWRRRVRDGLLLLTAVALLGAALLLPRTSAAEEAGLASPAAPLAAAAAPTEPIVVAFDKISAGDTAWMLTSSALVLMMTVPGLALFYAGMVRKKNVLATLMQSFAITCLVTVLWWLVGYSLAFTPGRTATTPRRRLGHSFLNGVVYLHDAGKLSVSHLGTTIPETVYAMFQLTFAIITPALICGSFAERMKFSAMLWFMGIWLLRGVLPDCALGLGALRLARPGGRAGLCRRYRSAHQRRHRRSGRRHHARQAAGPRAANLWRRTI